MTNSYEEKQEAKRQRYLELSGKANNKSNDLYDEAKKMASCIPFGQPILIGHHSESRDRNFRARFGRKYDKSFQESEKAKYYADKAEMVGTGGISSDDPDSIAKLQEKLESLQRNQKEMVEANKIIRKALKGGCKVENLFEAVCDDLKALNFSEENILVAVTLDYMKRIGFPAYLLQNNNANIRSVKLRIEELSARKNQCSVEKELKTFRFKKDIEENRFMFFFDGKPSPEIRDALKAGAFKWSPSRKAWVRQITGNASYAADNIFKFLVKLEQNEN